MFYLLDNDRKQSILYLNKPLIRVLFGGNPVLYWERLLVSSLKVGIKPFKLFNRNLLKTNESIAMLMANKWNVDIYTRNRWFVKVYEKYTENYLIILALNNEYIVNDTWKTWKLCLDLMDPFFTAIFYVFTTSCNWNRHIGLFQMYVESSLVFRDVILCIWSGVFD